MYSATTMGIEVRVTPAYTPERSAPESGVWFWTYHVEILNQSEGPVQLLTRHWEITDASGKVQHVRGDGVIGQQPLIEPGARFTYSSGCPLKTDNGIMCGEYQMVDGSGRRFMAKIPTFSLDQPHRPQTLN